MTSDAERRVIQSSIEMYEATKQTSVFGSQERLRAAERAWGESVRSLMGEKCGACGPPYGFCPLPAGHA